MSNLYRLSWEMVSQGSLKHFCNADPLYFSGVTQTVPNSEIPDEHWHPLSKETADPWSQYHQLKAWAEADKEFVRNVRLERAINPEIAWEPVDA